MSLRPSADVPAHLRPANLALVFAGGAAGVLARQLLMLVVPDAARVPAAVLLANVSGALLLGLLLSLLLAGGAETPARRRLRLLLGTGFLGGFTTYSALAQGALLLWLGGAPALAAAYGLGTVLLGGIASWCGVALGVRLGSRRSGEPEGGARD